jgi:hypothetical protein
MYQFICIIISNNMLMYCQWSFLLVNINATFLKLCRVLNLMKVPMFQLMKNLRAWNILLWCLLSTCSERKSYLDYPNIFIFSFIFTSYSTSTFSTCSSSSIFTSYSTSSSSAISTYIFPSSFLANRWDKLWPF